MNIVHFEYYWEIWWEKYYPLFFWFVCQCFVIIIWTSSFSNRGKDSQGEEVIKPYTPTTLDSDVGHFELVLKVCVTISFLYPMFFILFPVIYFCLSLIRCIHKEGCHIISVRCVLETIFLLKDPRWMFLERTIILAFPGFFFLMKFRGLILLGEWNLSP